MAHESLIVLAQFSKDEYDVKSIHALLESGELEGIVEESNFYKLVPDKYDYICEYSSEEQRNERMDKIYKEFLDEHFLDGTPLMSAVGNGYDRIFTANVSITERLMKENVEQASKALDDGTFTQGLYHDLFNTQWSPALALCYIDADGSYAQDPFAGPFTTTRKNFILNEASEKMWYSVIDAFDTHW